MLSVNIESISPEIAASYMLFNSSNRPISQTTVNSYATDMENGAFGLTHQGIAFYEDGSLADGQHRLSAIIKSGKTIQMIVTRGVERGLAIDRSRPRSVSDCAKIAGYEWIDRNVVGAITAMFSLNGVKKFTVNQSVTIAEKYKDSLLFVLSCVGSRVKGISHSGVVAGCVMAIENGVSKEKISRFYEVLKTGFAENNSERIIIKLRDGLISGDKNMVGWGSRRDVVLKTQRAIKAFVTGEIISKLITPENPIYEVKP